MKVLLTLCAMCLASIASAQNDELSSGDREFLQRQHKKCVTDKHDSVYCTGFRQGKIYAEDVSKVNTLFAAYASTAASDGNGNLLITIPDLDEIGGVLSVNPNIGNILGNERTDGVNWQTHTLPGWDSNSSTGDVLIIPFSALNGPSVPLR